MLQPFAGARAHSGSQALRHRSGCLLLIGGVRETLAMCRRGSGGLIEVGPLIAACDAAQASSGTEATVSNLLVELAQQGGERKPQALFGGADLLVGGRREDEARARGIVGGEVVGRRVINKWIVCRRCFAFRWLERVRAKPARPLAFLADGLKQGFWLVWHESILEFLRVHLFSSLYATKASASRGGSAAPVRASNE